MFRIKFILPYVIFFICLFTVLFSLNLFYKKYISNLNIDTRYFVTAKQAYDYKSVTLNEILNVVIGNKMNNKYLIENKIVEFRNMLTKKGISTINFILIVRKNHEVSEKKIETELNKFYLSAVNEIAHDLEKQLYLFDIIQMEETFAEDSYRKLINSNFFKKYPLEKCDSSAINCYKKYISTYNSILELLKSRKIDLDQILEDFQFNLSSKITLFEIISDIDVNKKLYELNDNFYHNKFDELKSTPLYKKHILDQYICEIVISARQCFVNIYSKLKDLSIIYELESSFPFTVKLVVNDNKHNSLSDAPVVLGLTSIMTYIFFILTNKFFRRKLK